MTQKTVGYVRLQWTCPNCGAKNPGPQKSCSGCGAAQPADVEFEQAAQEELVQDEAEIQRARSGPDVHCAYCGARNPAGATVCTQCGANLAEAAARAAGRVLGAHRAEPMADVACPACGAMNPATALKCSKCGASMAQPGPITAPATSAAGRGCSPIAIIGGIVAIGVIAALIFVLTRTSDVVGKVQGVSWMRSVAVEALGPATYQTWRDQVPREGKILSCKQEFRTRQDNPAPNAKEICATEYVDKGNGVAEVVETCYYEVYDDLCKYTIQEWQPVDQAVAEGSDQSPAWPVVNLSNGQREGSRAERYVIYFETNAGIKEYTTDSEALFAQLQPGSEWTLSVNSFGQVVEVSP